MIVVVDERPTVSEGYTAWFSREGISACGLAPGEFESWVSAISEPDMQSVEAFLLGECGNRGALAKLIRRLDETGLVVSELALRSPSLDEVFLTLTGHTTEES